MADPPPKADDTASDVDRALARLGEAIAANPTKHEPEPPPTPAKGKLIQLPLWPEPVRGAPNSLLRSALFAAIQSKTRKQFDNQLVGSMQGIVLRYTGKQLDQSDLDVWEQAIHLARCHPLGNVCHFTAYSFLKALGHGTGKAQYEWLAAVIRRLVGCVVVVHTKEKEYGGNLISSWKQDRTTRTYKLTLNPDTLKLYGWNDWTAIDFKQRQSLRGKPLALWLHGFYSSHAQPFAMKVETLRQLSGSANKDARGFKRRLKEAFADLEAATGIKGTIDSDLVTVERHGSRSQLRHLRRKLPQTGRHAGPAAPQPQDPAEACDQPGSVSAPSFKICF
jgi:hypothetical protein